MIARDPEGPDGATDDAGVDVAHAPGLGAAGPAASAVPPPLEPEALAAALAARPEGPLPPERLTFAEIPHPRQRAFLVAYATCAVVTRACHVAGVGRRTVYEWRHAEGPEGDRFRRAFDEAYEIAGDVLEMQAHRLAVEGLEEPLVSAGKIVGTKRVYSEKVLLALLAARRPQQFSAKTHVQLGVGPDLAEELREARERHARLRTGGAPALPALTARPMGDAPETERPPSVPPGTPVGPVDVGPSVAAAGSAADEGTPDLRPATPRSPRPYPSAWR